MATYHRNESGRKPYVEVKYSHREAKNEKHQRPKIRGLHELFSCELEHLDQSCEKPTL